MSVERRLNEIIFSKKISLCEVSDNSNISNSTLSRFLNGHIDMGTSKFLKLCKCLKVDIEVFLKTELDKMQNKKHSKVVLESDIAEVFWSLSKAGKRGLLLQLVTDRKYKKTSKTDLAVKRINNYLKGVL